VQFQERHNKCEHILYIFFIFHALKSLDFYLIYFVFFLCDDIGCWKQAPRTSALALGGMTNHRFSLPVISQMLIYFFTFSHNCKLFPSLYFYSPWHQRTLDIVQWMNGCPRFCKSELYLPILSTSLLNFFLSYIGTNPFIVLLRTFPLMSKSFFSTLRREKVNGVVAGV